jgi:hypothetical protein
VAQADHADGERGEGGEGCVTITSLRFLRLMDGIHFGEAPSDSEVIV